MEKLRYEKPALRADGSMGDLTQALGPSSTNDLTIIGPGIGTVGVRGTHLLPPGVLPPIRLTVAVPSAGVFVRLQLS